MADFFNSISSEFDAVEETDIPQTFDREIFSVTPGMIASMLAKIKKPKSMVPGDIPPKLVSTLAPALSVPLSYIFNAMPNSGWPHRWKKEFQTVIPKKPNPNDENECRNITCTNLFSKVLETFVLQGLLSEIEVSSFQFGGIKGTGVSHFLLHMWNEIML